MFPSILFTLKVIYFWTRKQRLFGINSWFDLNLTTSVFEILSMLETPALYVCLKHPYSCMYQISWICKHFSVRRWGIGFKFRIIMSGIQPVLFLQITTSTFNNLVVFENKHITHYFEMKWTVCYKYICHVMASLSILSE